MNNVILYLLIFLSLLEILPYCITILFPNLSYGSTSIGIIQQELNSKIYFSYINWFAYLILIIYFMYKIKNKKFKNKYYKYILLFLLFLCLYIPLYPFILIINVIMTLYLKNDPIIYDYHEIFPQSKLIEMHADDIIREFNKYININNVDCLRNSNPGLLIEISKKEENCWRGLFLKKSGVIYESLLKDFPITLQLIDDEQIHNAFFSILDPDVEIPKHTGYYKGYLRYHLGIIIPSENDKQPYIVVDNQIYYWKEKEGIVFDDIYLHYVKNPTNKKRVVLYLDIKRKFDNSFMSNMNNFGIFLLENSILLNFFIKNQHSQQKITNI